MNINILQLKKKALSKFWSTKALIGYDLKFYNFTIVLRVRNYTIVYSLKFVLTFP